MELIAGILALAALGAACMLVAALYDDRAAIYLADRLIARIEARQAYHARYQAVLAEREQA